MYQSETFLDYEIAYRRERMMDAGRGRRSTRGRRPWPTRPGVRRAR